MGDYHVVIVGAGAVGCATAYFLAKEGVQVTVLEGEKVGYGASGYAMGLLSPLSGIGLPGPLEELSNKGFAMHKFLARELRETHGIKYQARPNDDLHLAFMDDDLDDLKVLERLSSDVEGVDCQWIDGSQARVLEPRISQEVIQALAISGTWLVDSDGYTGSILDAAMTYGAQLLYRKVYGLRRLGSHIEILTECGSVEADKVVLAMGPWSDQINDWLDVEIPLYPLKGQILRLALPGKALRYTLQHGSNYAGSKPDGLVWVGTTEETVGFDDKTTEAARIQILGDVSSFLPIVADGRVILQTACLRPVTQDGFPVLGAVPGWEDVLIATGAGRKGILLSPSMGQAISQIITCGSSYYDLGHFEPTRFGGSLKF